MTTGTEYDGCWTMELGHMAIFGGTGALRDPETEREIYEHILKQQMAYMDGGDDDDATAAAVTPMAEEEEEVGMLQVLNHYTLKSVADVEIWLRDEAHRHEHYDEDVGRLGKFLAFQGVRCADGSSFKVHIELDDNVEDTLRALGACAYKGDAPGSALHADVQHINAEDVMSSLKVADAVSKTWREILMMKPITWSYPININIEMTLHNPHTVVVSSYEAGVALAADKKIRKQLK